MHADTKSVRLNFICEINFPWDAPHIYHFLHIYILALIPPNSHKALHSDPALIEYPTFDHVRALRGDGRGLASACACEDQAGGWVFLIEESWGQIKGEERESDKYAPPKTICETADGLRWHSDYTDTHGYEISEHSSLSTTKINNELVLTLYELTPSEFVSVRSVRCFIFIFSG